MMIQVIRNGIKQLLSSDKIIELHITGVCKRSGKPEAAAAYGIYLENNHLFNIAEPIVGTGTKTDNLAEVVALRRVLEMVNTFRSKWKKVIIWTASEYALRSRTPSTDVLVSGWSLWWVDDLKNGRNLPYKSEFVKIIELVRELISFKVKFVLKCDDTGMHKGIIAARRLAEEAVKVALNFGVCRMCNVSLGADPKLVDHDCRPFCCENEFSNKEEWFAHQNAAHGGAYPCKRSSCEIVFNSESELENHVKRTHAGKGLECEFCSVPFACESDRFDHVDVKCKEAPKCRSCDRMFDSLFDLLLHEYDDHPVAAVESPSMLVRHNSV